MPNWARLRFDQRPLSKTLTQQIAARIAETKGTGRSHVVSTVKDGFPVQVVVIFGDHTPPTVFYCNLAGLDDATRGDSRVRLAQALATLACGADEELE